MKLDFVMQKVKAKARKNLNISTARILSSITSLFNYGVKKDLAIEPDKIEKKPVFHPGKKEASWNDITCSCAAGDSLILGFGNGALVCLNTRNDV
jgi:hypothetical protein